MVGECQTIARKTSKNFESYSQYFDASNELLCAACEARLIMCALEREPRYRWFRFILLFRKLLHANTSFVNAFKPTDVTM
jgi:hypothetical protein